MLKLGYVKVADFGCGCSLSLNKLDLRNDRLVFISSMGDFGYVNVNGKTFKLRLDAASKEKQVVKVGDRSWERYSSGSVKVRIDYVVTGLCDPNDEACEVIAYNALINITRGKRSRVVRTIGICGC